MARSNQNRIRQTWHHKSPKNIFLISTLVYNTPFTTSFILPAYRGCNTHDTKNKSLKNKSVTAVVKRKYFEELSPLDTFEDFEHAHHNLNELTMYDSMLMMPYCAINPTYDLSAPYVSRLDSESTFVEYTEDGLVIPAGPVGQCKEVTANILNEPSVEIVIASVVLINSVLVALSTFDSLNDLMPTIRGAEIVVSCIFCADFLARWFSSSRDNGKFVLDSQFVVDVMVVILPLLVAVTPDWFWDIVTFLPPALSKPSELFNLRLLRVLRLQRFLRDLDTFERFAEQVLGRQDARTYIVQDWQLQLSRVVLSLFTLISIVSGLIYTAESSVNPDIDNYFDALYFSLTTLTTVGFGDVSPVTWQGKLIVCGSIVVGVAVVPAQAAALVEALLDREKARNGKAIPRKTFWTNESTATSNRETTRENVDSKNEKLALDTNTACPHCGTSFHWSCAQYCYTCGGKL
jgi:voltage-gated potassium channel